MKTPTKTVEFLDAIRARFRFKSDYELCNYTGLKKSTVGNYRQGKGFFDSVIAVKIAGLLDLPEGYVLACIQAERETRAKRTEVAKVWRNIAETLRVAMVVFLLGFLGLAPLQNAEAGSESRVTPFVNNMYYAHARLWSWLYVWLRPPWRILSTDSKLIFTPV